MPRRSGCHCAIFARIPAQPAQRLPALDTWRARATPAPTPAWWRHALQHSAALSLRGEGLAVEGEHWLHADPVHLSLLRDHFILEPPADLQLSAEDAQRLVEALNQHFACDGLHWIAAHPQRWYVRLPDCPRLLTFPLSSAVGRDTRACLPRGTDAMVWQQRLTEAQMLLHTHPVNQAREARGRAPVNSLWLHADAAETMPPSVEWPAGIWAEEVLARGLALSRGIPLHTLPADAEHWLQEAPPAGVQALILDAMPAEALDQQWCAPLMKALRRGRLAGLSLYSLHDASAAGWQIRWWDLWKFWRRPPPVGARRTAAPGVADGT